MEFGFVLFSFFFSTEPCRCICVYISQAYFGKQFTGMYMYIVLYYLRYNPIYIRSPRLVNLIVAHLLSIQRFWMRIRRIHLDPCANSLQWCWYINSVAYTSHTNVLKLYFSSSILQETDNYFCFTQETFQITLSDLGQLAKHVLTRNNKN